MDEKENRINNSIEKQCRKFCPLLRANCTWECVCFEPAMFTETNHFFEATCKSPLIDGVISVEGLINNY